MKFLAGIIIGGALAASILVVHSQTTPSQSWRYDFDQNGAVTIGDVIAVLPHVGETYALPGPCHQFVSFPTPVTLPDGTYLDGYFADDLTLPPSRDYLTC